MGHTHTQRLHECSRIAPGKRQESGCRIEVASAGWPPFSTKEGVRTVTYKIELEGRGQARVEDSGQVRELSILDRGGSAYTICAVSIGGT